MKVPRSIDKNEDTGLREILLMGTLYTTMNLLE